MAFSPIMAANLATPMFLIDAAGTLIYYNEAAEFEYSRARAPPLGAVTANEFGGMLELADLDGAPVRRRDTPAGITFSNASRRIGRCLSPRSTAHRRRVEVTTVSAFRPHRRHA